MAAGITRSRPTPAFRPRRVCCPGGSPRWAAPRRPRRRPRPCRRPPRSPSCASRSASRGSCRHRGQRASAAGTRGARYALGADDRDEEHEGGHDADEDALHGRVVGHGRGAPGQVRLQVLASRCAIDPWLALLFTHAEPRALTRFNLRRRRRHHLRTPVSLRTPAASRCKTLTLPTWYATPGNVARNAGGDISAS